jgi:hypothetical protein
MALLSGCASYHAASLNRYPPEMLMKDTQLAVSAKVFDKADCKRYLDRDVLAKGYQPIQLFIENNTDKSYLLLLDQVGLASYDPETVARSVHTSTVGRVLGYGIPGLVIAWPLIIPAIVDGIKSSEANDALDMDFYVKSVKEDQVLLPGSRFNKLVFADLKEVPAEFTVTLVEQESKKPEVFHIKTI